MLTVALVVLAVIGAWLLASVSIALVAGGVIHARDHRDAPFGGFRSPAAPLVGARSRR